MQVTNLRISELEMEKSELQKKMRSYKADMSQVREEFSSYKSKTSTKLEQFESMHQDIDRLRAENEELTLRN